MRLFSNLILNTLDDLFVVELQDLYGTARTVAQQLGYQEITQLLDHALEEEFGAAKTLTQIAESSVNVGAAGA